MLSSERERERERAVMVDKKFPFFLNGALCIEDVIHTGIQKNDSECMEMRITGSF